MFKEFGFNEILEGRIYEKYVGNKIIEVTKIDDFYSMNEILIMNNSLGIQSVVIDRLRSVTLQDMKEVLEKYK